MRSTIFFISIFYMLVLTSCSNSGKGESFCDTTCKGDSFNFKGNHPLNPIVSIGVKGCKADTLLWTHDLAGSKMLSLPEFLGQPVTINKAAIDCYFKDTSYAWLQLNDCVTGRGFLLKLNYDKSKENRKITAAFTRFDPKFSIDPDLIVYTDRGSVFVENLLTEKQAILPFDKPYKIDFNKMHEMVDSVKVTKSNIYVKMIRDGQPKVYEKKISL